MNKYVYFISYVINKEKEFVFMDCIVRADYLIQDERNIDQLKSEIYQKEGTQDIALLSFHLLRKERVADQPQYARPYGRDQQCPHEQEVVQVAAAEDLAKIVSVPKIVDDYYAPGRAQMIASMRTSPGDGEWKLADEGDNDGA